MQKNKETLIVSYINPDLDTYGCALGYAELLRQQGIDASAGAYGSPLAEVQFLLNYLRVVPLPTFNPADFDQLIVVDCSRTSNLDARLDAEKVVEVVDHRRGNDPADFPHAAWNVEIVGAAATLIAEKYQAAGVEPSVTAAAFMMAAIISNTMNFQSAATTERDRTMAHWLNRYAQLPRSFAQQLFQAKSDTQGDKLHQQINGDFSLLDPVEGWLVGVGQLEMIGAAELIDQRKDEIVASLSLIQSQRQTDGAYAALIDIQSAITYFVTDDVTMQQLLSKTLQLHFSQGVAAQAAILPRKEYIPELKAEIAQMMMSQSMA